MSLPAASLPIPVSPVMQPASTSETSGTALEDPAESTVMAKLSTTSAASESGATSQLRSLRRSSQQCQTKMRRCQCSFSAATVREPMPSQSTQPVPAPSSHSENSTASDVPPQEGESFEITTRGAAKAAVVKASSKHKPGVISKQNQFMGRMIHENPNILLAEYHTAFAALTDADRVALQAEYSQLRKAQKSK
ncbi:hypothetical protein BV25DRAFT_1901097 [Artomyces pyxidatus]|uniref:Uncharacterized protein n=1 Tax=Artomyces pyxidatus TaxID=48021 RepID=A0ACB8SVM6_9AGAM|nr:hypothetical protein BV25DRAFT_1901097 [Artomyces pyxidatus]